MTSKRKIINNTFFKYFLSVANLSKKPLILFKNFILYIKGNIIILNNKEVCSVHYNARIEF